MREISGDQYGTTDNSRRAMAIRRRGRETWHWHAPHVLTYPITGNVRESRRYRIAIRKRSVSRRYITRLSRAQNDNKDVIPTATRKSTESFSCHVLLVRRGPFAPQPQSHLMLLIALLHSKLRETASFSGRKQALWYRTYVFWCGPKVTYFFR